MSKKKERQLLDALHKAFEAFEAADPTKKMGVIIIGIVRDEKSDKSTMKMMSNVSKPVVPRLLAGYAQFLAKGMN